ncbi:hypothetical protein POL68_40650 [Stigmatella sp. ncwal1]|uniref:Trichohyalin n=1 Tax=Stigmatella ashevillensis TaxID=2995309 RepID=A0ABT5DMJ8_9BACT|nr:hypothetical protein [Stigmatella ashevillena]MDC0714829.1 hypothetical protein [Stigmatella ashevillena]
MSKWLLATMAFSLPVLAFADGPHRRGERVENRQEAQQNRQEQRDDRRDLKQLENLIARFDAAWSRRHHDALRQVDADLRAYVAADLAENRYELSDAQAEVRRDTHEVRDARYAHDRREFQDAQRDRRDDKRDVRVEAEALRRTRGIQRELEGLYGRVDRNSLERKRSLMMELLQMARTEQEHNRQEIREDRRESREDRREARDHRY